MKIAGLTSDGGPSLMHVHDRAPGGAALSVVIADREDAPALDAAAARGVPTEVVAPDDPLDPVADYGADLVCLDGYAPSLPDAFLDAAPATLDVHASLLPAFPGSDPVGDALDAGVRVTGCTVHAVTPGGDRPIVSQEPVPVREDDTPGALAERVRREGAFRAYPRAVGWFAADRVSIEGGRVSVEGDGGGDFPTRRLESDDRERGLRYGENPHQAAALYVDATCEEASVVGADQLNEGAKALSYNNYNDADAALGLVREFDRPAAAVIKHTNPAGCATAETVAEAYDRALSTDPMSAFGGVVALNRECDAETAESITGSFKEVVVAPGYTDAALSVLGEKANLRVLDVGALGERTERVAEKPVVGGRLVQDRDLHRLDADGLEMVTGREPTDEQIESMLFAWRVVKHVKSNAIVLASGTETVGVGMGQVSRVDAVELAARKAAEHAEGKSAEGAVMASDAFFPFPDGIEAGAEAGVEAVVQPGGSVNDEDVIAAADDLGLAMAFTGVRAFRHD